MQAISDKAEQERLLMTRLKFGTAGLRGPMGPGYCQMNELTVIQATQGLCAYLKQFHADKKAADLSVAIGYDHRKYGTLRSETFARLAAAVVVQSGMKAYLLQGFVATPLVPFTLGRYGCAAGIMVTASHNPKRDNGYKVYWQNGSQIVPPHDSGIHQCILDNLAPWAQYSAGTISQNPSCLDPTASVVEAYFEKVRSTLCQYPEENKKAALKIAYTAMHGVGRPFTARAFKEFQLPPFIPVSQQCEPDPEFSTVKFPNPEEKGALDLAKAAARKAGATIVLANDPDADRLAAAELTAGGDWRAFSGNEIGILFADWMWTQYLRKNPKCDRSKVVMLNSTVSSKMLRAYAEKNGFRYVDTLTGFKWMGNEAGILADKGLDVIFMFEEAIGYCLGSVVRDKDGVSAAAAFAEMANFLQRERKETVAAHLEGLYSEYGYFFSNNHYVRQNDMKIIDQIFSRLRNGGSYWFKVGPYTIKRVRDLEVGFDSATEDGKATLPKSKVLTYEFNGGCVMTLRPSGTEPKLKYYIELSGSSEAATRRELEQVSKTLLASMLQVEQ